MPGRKHHVINNCGVEGPQPIKVNLMFIKVRENDHPGYEVLAVNLNACDRIILNEVVGGFQLVLEKAVDLNLNSQILIENYEQKTEAIHAFEYIMNALKRGDRFLDIQSVS